MTEKGIHSNVKIVDDKGNKIMAGSGPGLKKSLTNFSNKHKCLQGLDADTAFKNAEQKNGMVILDAVKLKKMAIQNLKDKKAKGAAEKKGLETIEEKKTAPKKFGHTRLKSDFNVVG